MGINIILFFSIEISCSVVLQKEFCLSYHGVGIPMQLIKSKAVPLPPCRLKGGAEYSSYSFLNSTLDGVSSQRRAPAALYPWSKDSSTHRIGGWVVLRGGLYLYLYQGLKPDRPLSLSL